MFSSPVSLLGSLLMHRCSLSYVKRLVADASDYRECRPVFPLEEKVCLCQKTGTTLLLQQPEIQNNGSERNVC